MVMDRAQMPFRLHAGKLPRSLLATGLHSSQEIIVRTGVSQWLEEEVRTLELIRF